MSEQFWTADNLKQMHIELTNACNAACPMCVRFHNASPHIRPDLEIGQITLEKFKKYFPPKIIQQCNLILFCGVHGDPCIAKDILEICEYIYECSPVKTAVRINTNGGMRKADWWQQLGLLFSRKNIKTGSHWAVTFSIDGLEDTNHLYRRNVKWNQLIENVTAYIAAGGIANWDYLIFKHNEHQIQAALELSKNLKFDEFVPKKALGVDNGKNLVPMAVLNKDGELDYTIEAPENPKNRNLENPQGVEPVRAYTFKLEDYRQLKIKKDTGNNFQDLVKKVYDDRIANENFSKADKCGISCKSHMWHNNGKEIFVDNFGRVMPCCYIGTHLNGTYNDTPTLQLHKHMNDYGWEKFSLDNYTLEEILNRAHLDRVFADSWTKESVKEGKLAYCSDICGSESRIDKIFTHEINNKAEKFKMSRNRTNE